MASGKPEQNCYFEEFRESQLPESLTPLGLIKAISGVRSSPFDVPYPVQKSGSVPLTDHAGELRGYYHRSDSSDRWKPSWSKFGYPRPGATHQGVDIYAPVGTKVVAIADGYAMLYPDPTLGNDLGIRVGITFKGSDGKKYDVLYGHLKSVEGISRQVVKGELIGRTGCTGNADDGTCATANACNGYSSHVHIAVRESISGASYIDPVALFGWTIDYENDNRDVPCQDAFT